MALIAVLGVLAVTGLMIAHLAIMGEVIQRESVVVAERSRLKYEAESAVGDALWSYLVDRRLYANRALGQIDAARENSMTEPWMLDGRRHGGGPDTRVTVALTDAVSGIDVSGNTPASELQDRLDPDDEEQNEQVKAFLDVAADYVDGNDLRHEPDGKERDDYESEGIPNFPRNGPLQFREEVYWLDGWREALTDKIRIIPPKGIQVAKASSTKPPFFSSSPAFIQRLLKLDDNSLTQILAARRAWREDQIPLNDSLDADLIGRINSSFSLAESGMAVVEAMAESPVAGISRQVRLALNGDLRRPEAFSDKHNQALAIWDRRFF